LLLSRLLFVIVSKESMTEAITISPGKVGGGLGTFEQYLSVWVALCMVTGIGIGKLLPDAVASIRGVEFGKGSQINAPIAMLIWLMITPMMMKVDFSSVKNVGRRPVGLLVTLFINWVVKPFSMALLAWAIFRIVFAAFITPAEADQYIAGCHHFGRIAFVRRWCLCGAISPKETRPTGLCKCP
jgi:arsenite transporter